LDTYKKCKSPRDEKLQKLPEIQRPLNGISSITSTKNQRSWPSYLQVPHLQKSQKDGQLTGMTGTKLGELAS
jgi:hypothetical protein